MDKYKKSFSFAQSDFMSELISQHFIIDYIEENFFQKFSKVKEILNMDIDKEEIFADNQNFVTLLNNTINSKVDEFQSSKRHVLKTPNWLKDVDSRSEFGELISYASDCLEMESYVDNEMLFNKIKKDIFDTNQNLNYKEKLEHSDEEIYKAIIAAKIMKNNNFYYESKNDKETLLSFKTNLRLFDNYSLSNIYRQIFINVFSIFDACVFDTLKDFFNKNIHELEIFFNPNNSKNDVLKFSFDDLLELSDMESIYNAMIETRFTGKYLSNIVKLLNKYKEDFFDKSLNLSSLLEAINRRNIHVHKKGVVDKKYINDINLFSFKDGDIAYISRDYLYETFEMLTSFDNKLNILVNEIVNN